MRSYLADDFAVIRRRVLELQSEQKSATSIGAADRHGIDVVCTQPDPEDLGIINGGADHIAIRRSPTAPQP